MLFRHGFSYLAGFDYPMIVGRQSLIDAVEEKGFMVYAVADCEDWGPVPFETPSRCGGSWDWMAYVVRTGPTEELELPSRVKWIREIGPGGEPLPPGYVAPGPTPRLPAPRSSGVVISRQQATLHAVSEAVGVLVTVPFFFYASEALPTKAGRTTALWLGVGALAVDGFLLWRYLSKTTDKPIV